MSLPSAELIEPFADGILSAQACRVVLTDSSVHWWFLDSTGGISKKSTATAFGGVAVNSKMLAFAHSGAYTEVDACIAPWRL